MERSRDLIIVTRSCPGRSGDKQPVNKRKMKTMRSVRRVLSTGMTESLLFRFRFDKLRRDLADASGWCGRTLTRSVSEVAHPEYSTGVATVGRIDYKLQKEKDRGTNEQSIADFSQSAHLEKSRQRSRNRQKKNFKKSRARSESSSAVSEAANGHSAGMLPSSTRYPLNPGLWMTRTISARDRLPQELSGPRVSWVRLLRSQSLTPCVALFRLFLLSRFRDSLLRPA